MAIAPVAWHACASLQLQPDHAHQPVGHLLVAVELGGVRDHDAAVIDIEQRLVLLFEPWSICRRSPCAAPWSVTRRASSSALSASGLAQAL